MKKKIERYNLHFLLPKVVHQKLLKLTGEYSSVTDTIIKMIEYNYNYQVKKGRIKDLDYMTDDEKATFDIINYDWLGDQDNEHL